MKSYLQLELSHPQPLPPEFQDEDVRYPEALVERFIQEYTHPGAVVFDPFAGYGTTLVVAQRMGRVAYGIELNPAKAAYARSRLSSPANLLLGDARQLASMDFPPVDFSLTSPPYTSLDDQDDPFSDYTRASRGYTAYLRDLRSVYGQLRSRMKPAGIVVLEIANIKRNGRVTPLAWDAAHEISQVLRFEGEVVVCWDAYGYGYEHSYCLVFTAL